MKSYPINKYIVLFCFVFINITLFAQKSTIINLEFTPENLPQTLSFLRPFEPKVLGDADKTKSKWINNLKNPKIMEVAFAGDKFQFAVGFDKEGNKWMIPYNFADYQPYRDVPFKFNEDCTEETIYLRLSRYRNLRAYTIRRYYQEEKDKNGIGKSSYGKMMFDMGTKGYHRAEFTLDNMKYKVNVWHSMIEISDTINKSYLFRHHIDVKGPIITINNKKYFATLDTYKAQATLRLDLVTDSLLAKNKNLVTPTDFSKFMVAGLTDKKNSYLKDLVAKKGYTLIGFWGTWCGPCLKELPNLAEVYKDYGSKVSFLSVAFDSDLEKIAPIMQKNGITWSQYFLTKTQEKSQAEKFSINSFPTFMLLDNKGQVVYRSDRDDENKDIVEKKDVLLKVLKKYVGE